MHRKRTQQKRDARADASVGYLFNTQELGEKIEAHFSKRFAFTRPRSEGDSPWILPDARDVYEAHEELLWNDPSRTALKNELNSVKDLLSDKDIVLWHQHTRDVNIASKVVPHVRYRMRAELCTQAWCKFYEILCNFPLVPFDPALATLNSVHLCEAPGAFIAALNHYLALNHVHLKLAWLATTLNPYYEGNKVGQTIPDDRFILPTLEHWDFGKDNTGNIFSSSNRSSLLEKAKKLGPIHLVTADGSIDCQNNPSEQESLVAPLHLVEVVTALGILSSKGSLVVKLFTCFEPTSICLLYLLNCAFSQVHVFKPGTSKRGNSEVYVIGLDYSGDLALQSHLSKIEAYLERPFGTFVPMFTPQVLPNTFVRQMTECCAYFQTRQVEAIQEHLRLFQKMDPEQKRQMERAKAVASQTFVKKFGLAPIGEEASIIKKKKLLAKPALQNKPLRMGSLNQRKTITDLSWHQQLPHLETDLARTAPQLSACANNETIIEHLLMPLDHCVDVSMMLGKEFHNCWNSHFCDFPVMHCWNEIYRCFKESGHPNPRIEELNVPELVHAILGQMTSDPTRPVCQFVALNQLCHSLAEYLGQSWQNSSECDTLTNIFLDDLRYNNSSWEVCYSSEATIRHLSRFCDAVKRCGLGDWLIIAIGPLLTRVQAGLLYILHCGFKKITLLSVWSNGQPVELAICRDCVSPISTSLLAKLKPNCDKEDAILEVLSISSLFGDPFFTSLHRFNSCALMQRAKFALSYLKTLIPSKAQKNET